MIYAATYRGNCNLTLMRLNATAVNVNTLSEEAIPFNIDTLLAIEGLRLQV